MRYSHHSTLGIAAVAGGGLLQSAAAPPGRNRVPEPSNIDATPAQFKADGADPPTASVAYGLQN